MQYEVENKADLCPVCNGSGIYINYKYSGTTIKWQSKTTCHGCGGKGWVVVPTINTTVTGGKQ